MRQLNYKSFHFCYYSCADITSLSIRSKFFQFSVLKLSILKNNKASNKHTVFPENYLLHISHPRQRHCDSFEVLIFVFPIGSQSSYIYTLYKEFNKRMSSNACKTLYLSRNVQVSYFQLSVSLVLCMIGPNSRAKRHTTHSGL